MVPGWHQVFCWARKNQPLTSGAGSRVTVSQQQQETTAKCKKNMDVKKWQLEEARHMYRCGLYSLEEKKICSVIF